ncbi:hypothetical protein L2E82_33178 [Cichorium intybus]|uniref:Uncharacterized protein n=1 Tax=Cichorium intybus TaxID=13427 RepID=A0ACB9BJF3_CICIN|nr:hypothetical protein L2E82_33178 [Cichorium intybus]
MNMSCNDSNFIDIDEQFETCKALVVYGQQDLHVLPFTNAENPIVIEDPVQYEDIDRFSGVAGCFAEQGATRFDPFGRGLRDATIARGLGDATFNRGVWDSIRVGSVRGVSWRCACTGRGVGGRVASSGRDVGGRGAGKVRRAQGGRVG